ncbi:MAG TPA: hypothetical protein VGG43_02010 [Acidimicrobiales bacterium]|jgi:hypothetical protein
MSTTEAPEVISGDADTSRVMHRVTAELGEIAAVVDRVSEVSPPTVELLEARRAIQSALVSLGNWNGSHEAREQVSGAGTAMLTLSDAWIAFRPHDPWDRVRSTSLDA